MKTPLKSQLTAYNGASGAQENIGFISDDLRVSLGTDVDLDTKPVLIAGIDPDNQTNSIAVATVRNDNAGKDLGIATYTISKNTILSFYRVSATKTNDIMLTTSATKRTFLTGVMMSYSATALCDSYFLQVAANMIGKPSFNDVVAQMEKLPLVASQNSSVVMFHNPIEIDPNSTILFTSGWSAGMQYSTVILYGYEVKT